MKCHSTLCHMMSIDKASQTFLKKAKCRLRVLPVLDNFCNSSREKNVAFGIKYLWDFKGFS